MQPSLLSTASITVLSISLATAATCYAYKIILKKIERKSQKLLLAIGAFIFWFGLTNAFNELVAAPVLGIKINQNKLIEAFVVFSLILPGIFGIIIWLLQPKKQERSQPQAKNQHELVIEIKNEPIKIKGENKIIFSAVILVVVVSIALIVFEKVEPKSQADKTTTVRLKAYSCNSEAEAISCSKCEEAKGIAIEYIANSEKQLVLRKVFENESLIDTDALDNCKVASASNWICQTKSNPNDVNVYSSKNKTVMTDGKVYQSSAFYTSGIKKSNIPPLRQESYTCYK